MISIIIPTYNDNDPLTRCLAAITASPVKPLEVIVVDDGSDQPVQDIVAQYGYTSIRLERNSGQATARNAGARLARGDILFFIDSDVAVGNDTLQKVTNAFRDNTVFIYQGIPSKKPLNEGFGPELLALKMYYMLKDCRQASYVHSHLFSIKKSLFEEIGGFNTSFKPPGCGEEFDLGHRLREKYIIHTDPELVAEQKGVPVLDRARVLYFRAYAWATLFRKTRKFEKTNASFSEAMIGVCNVVGIACLLLSVVHLRLMYAALGFFLAHLLAAGGFYRFLAQEKGILFMLRGVLPNMLWSVAVVAGGGIYFLDDLCGRVK